MNHRTKSHKFLQYNMLDILKCAATRHTRQLGYHIYETWICSIK